MQWYHWKNKFDGTKSSTPIEDYLVQFQYFADEKGWGDRMKGNVLASSLSGRATQVLTRMPGDRLSYTELTSRLLSMFRTSSNLEVCRSEFRNRSRKPTETAAEYALELQQLAHRAFAMSSHEDRSYALLEQFRMGQPPLLRHHLIGMDLSDLATAIGRVTRTEAHMQEEKSFKHTGRGIDRSPQMVNVRSTQYDTHKDSVKTADIIDSDQYSGQGESRCDESHADFPTPVRSGSYLDENTFTHKIDSMVDALSQMHTSRDLDITQNPLVVVNELIEHANEEYTEENDELIHSFVFQKLDTQQKKVIGKCFFCTKSNHRWRQCRQLWDILKKNGFKYFGANQNTSQNRGNQRQDGNFRGRGRGTGREAYQRDRNVPQPTGETKTSLN
jgi:hypothetical protein